MSRKYEYINISTPIVRAKPGLSHDLQLLRDLEIANARTVAELGPLPLGGLPVVPKHKFIPPQTAALTKQASLENQEEEAMNLNRMVAVAVLAAGIAACEPSQETVAAEQTQITAPTVKQAASVASEIHAEPIVAAVSERATTDAAPAVPDEIRAFVPQDSTLLAYKRFDLTGDGNEDTVLIIHHTPDENDDFSKNPCDLVVLHGKESAFTLAGKNSKAVDCTYKQYLDGENRPDDLNYMLELSTHEIACNYESDRPMGTSTFYTFKYSNRKNAWYLSQARNAYKSSDIDGRGYLAIEEVNYPADVGFIEISEFDPRKLRTAFKRNRDIEYFEEEE